MYFSILVILSLKTLLNGHALKLEKIPLTILGRLFQILK